MGVAAAGDIGVGPSRRVRVEQSAVHAGASAPVSSGRIGEAICSVTNSTRPIAPALTWAAAASTNGL